MRAGEGRAVSLLTVPVRRRGGGRPQPTVSWPKNLWLDTYCQAVTMTSMQAVVALQCLAARGYRRWGDFVPEPLAEAGRREAVR